jgi:hypothetical protein
MRAPRPWRCSPREALVAARALLPSPLPPPLRAEPRTPEGKWLDELASLVRKACPRPGALGSRTIARGLSNGDSRPPSQQPTPCRLCDLRSRLDQKIADDARTTLERTREWRREAEEDHTSSDCPAQGNQGQHGSAGDDDIGPYWTGCRAFTVDLWQVDWPTKFRPDITEKYDGTIDPEEFLQIYTTTIQAVGRGPQVMANNFYVALRDTVRSWLMNLTLGSVGSWGELCQQFITNFSRSFNQPGTLGDLLAVRQRKGKTLQQ